MILIKSALHDSVMINIENIMSLIIVLFSGSVIDCNLKHTHTHTQ